MANLQQENLLKRLPSRVFYLVASEYPNDQTYIMKWASQTLDPETLYQFYRYAMSFSMMYCREAMESLRYIGHKLQKIYPDNFESATPAYQYRADSLGADWTFGKSILDMISKLGAAGLDFAAKVHSGDLAYQTALKKMEYAYKQTLTAQKAAGATAATAAATANAKLMAMIAAMQKKPPTSDSSKTLMYVAIGGLALLLVMKK